MVILFYETKIVIKILYEDIYIFFTSKYILTRVKWKRKGRKERRRGEGEQDNNNSNKLTPFLGMPPQLENLFHFCKSPILINLHSTIT